MPSDHRLAAREAVAIEELKGETFLGMSETAPTVQAAIEAYLAKVGVPLNLHTASTISPWRCR